MELKEALQSLDTMEDDHWTTDGSPKLDVLKAMVGAPVSRADVMEVAPQFNRANPNIGVPSDEDQNDAVQQEEKAEEVIINDAVEEYLSGEPLEAREFAQLLNTAADAELPVLEKVLEEQMAAADENRRAAEELYRTTKMNLSLTRVSIKQRVPDVSNDQAIQDYIKKQFEARAGRYQQVKDIKEQIGVDVSKLDPRKPIDRAMARKTGRGGNRPNRPFMNG